MKFMTEKAFSFMVSYYDNLYFFFIGTYQFNEKYKW